MSFLISLLLYLGVITTADQVNQQNAATYQAQYETEANIDAFYRGGNPLPEDNM